MARPTRNNAEFFYHSANFRNDRRVKAIRARFGLAGYGLTLMLMEALTDADHTFLSTDELEIELLAGDFGVSVTEIHSLLQLCEKISLFQRNGDGNLICQDLNESLQQVFDKRNRAREAEKEKQKKVSVTETGVSVAETPQSKGKESNTKVLPKGKKKEKKDSSADSSAVGSQDSADEYTLTHKLRLVVESVNAAYYWDAKDGATMQKLAVKLRQSFQKTKGREATDEDICDSLRRLITEMNKLPAAYYHFKEVSKLNSDYNAILNEIKNPSRLDGKNGTAVSIAPKFKSGTPD